MLTREEASAVIEVRLPLPPKACSPNFHGHWRTRNRDTKTYRETCRWKIHNHLLHRLDAGGPVRISADFYCARVPGDGCVRPLDIQNAIGCLKAAVDGFMDAGLVPNDSHAWVTWGDVRLFRTKALHKGRAEVVVRIERVRA